MHTVLQYIDRGRCTAKQPLLALCGSTKRCLQYSVRYPLCVCESVAAIPQCTGVVRSGRLVQPCRLLDCSTVSLTSRLADIACRLTKKTKTKTLVLIYTSHNTYPSSSPPSSHRCLCVPSVWTLHRTILACRYGWCTQPACSAYAEKSRLRQVQSSCCHPHCWGTGQHRDPAGPARNPCGFP